MVHFRSNGSGHDDSFSKIKTGLEKFAQDQPVDFASLQDKLQELVEAHNASPDESLGGFSPSQLYALARHPWNTPGSPLKLKTDFSVERLERESPFFRNVRAFLLALQTSGGTKATSADNLNRKFVASMADTFLTAAELAKVNAICKVVNEQDVWPLHIARVVCQQAGVITLRKGQFQVKKKSAVLLRDDRAGELFAQLFQAYFTRFNLEYGTRRPSLEWLQQEAGYVFFTMQRQAKDWLKVEELPKRLLAPVSLKRLESELEDAHYYTPKDAMINFFVSPLAKWGLLEVVSKKERFDERPQRIRTRKLFHELVIFE